MTVKEVIKVLESIKDKNKKVGLVKDGKFKELDGEIGITEYKNIVLLQPEIYVHEEHYY